jgi:hypothetical protein
VGKEEVDEGFAKDMKFHEGRRYKPFYERLGRRPKAKASQHPTLFITQCGGSLRSRRAGEDSTGITIHNKIIIITTLRVARPLIPHPPFLLLDGCAKPAGAASVPLARIWSARPIKHTVAAGGAEESREQVQQSAAIAGE